MANPDADNRAQMAMSLRDNPAFQDALASMRADAVEHLCAADPTNSDAIRTHQATVSVIDEFGQLLERYVRSGQPPKSPGLA